MESEITATNEYAKAASELRAFADRIERGELKAISFAKVMQVHPGIIMQDGTVIEPSHTHLDVIIISSAPLGDAPAALTNRLSYLANSLLNGWRS